MSGCVAGAGSTGLPDVVGTGMSVPVGDAYGVKGGGDGRDGGGGIWRQARINRGVTVATEYIRDGVYYSPSLFSRLRTSPPDFKYAGGRGGRLERDRDREPIYNKKFYHPEKSGGSTIMNFNCNELRLKIL